MEQGNGKKHNGIISFWKFMFSILIVIFHLTIMTEGGEVLFKYGAIGVEFFFLISGYLMTKKAMSNNKDCSNIGQETAGYIWKKIKAFFPYILIAFIISLFVNNWNEPYKKNQIVNSVWNLLLMQMSGIKETSVVGQTWYISAMLISMMILYPLIRKYKKNFTYLIAPIIVLLLSGWISHTYGKLTGPLTWTGFAYKGLLRAFFEIALGSILYEIAEKMKNINFTKFARLILTAIEIVGFISIFFITNIKDASSKYDFIMLAILAISITISFSEKTIFYNFANNRFFYYLEKLSLPIYLNHIWIIIIINKTLSNLNYIQKLGILMISTIVFSMIIMYLIELAKKHIDKNKKNLKRLLVN